MRENFLLLGHVGVQDHRLGCGQYFEIVIYLYKISCRDCESDVFNYKFPYIEAHNEISLRLSYFKILEFAKIFKAYIAT